MSFWPLALVKRLVAGVPLTPAQGDGNLSDIEASSNDLNTRLNVALNADGTLKAGAINASNVFAAGVIPATALAANATFPVGTIIAVTNSAFGTGSDGWLWADGTPAVRATYPALHTLYQGMAYPYGAGDGVSTFGIPDLRGLTLVGTSPGGLGVLRPSVRTIGAEKTLAIGAETVILDASEMPVHQHNIVGYSVGGGPQSVNVDGSAGGPETMQTAMAGGTAGATAPHLNMMPSGIVKFCVKV